MTTYISILRGINVSGQKKVEMKGLKSLYEELGFKDVCTYIQSGNVLFNHAGKITTIALIEKIENAILKTYGFDVPVIIRTAAELKQIISGNPFISQKDINEERLHITFLDKSPDSSVLKAIKQADYSPDRFIMKGTEVYLYCPNGYGITRLSNTFFEKKLAVTATTRNWKTVNKLLELTHA